MTDSVRVLTKNGSAFSADTIHACAHWRATQVTDITCFDLRTSATNHILLP
jgi:hypothetical protein